MEALRGGDRAGAGAWLVSRLSGIAARLRSILHRRETEDRMEEEFRFHLDMETARLDARRTVPGRGAAPRAGVVRRHGHAPGDDARRARRAVVRRPWRRPPLCAARHASEPRIRGGGRTHPWGGHWREWHRRRLRERHPLPSHSGDCTRAAGRAVPSRHEDGCGPPVRVRGVSRFSRPQWRVRRPGRGDGGPAQRRHSRCGGIGGGGGAT